MLAYRFHVVNVASDAMPQTHLMLYWHMHQPFYKDLSEGTYSMPWTRLHAWKDYYGMVAMLREFPDVHVTFNYVPSLVAQLEDYIADNVQEEPYRIAFKPAGQLTGDERMSLLDFAFDINRENLLNRFTRFRELFEKREATQEQAEPFRLFTTHDVLDLQVLSQLAWFDEIYLESDREIRGLVDKGRRYSEADKATLRRKGIELFKGILEECRTGIERGQIEVSTSPFYHPILPLLCNTDIASESHPGVKLPRRTFRHPEDARSQLRAAVELHQRVFGVRPAGLWPSEGSVSDKVLRLAIQEGFEWAATDEGVLGRSLQIAFYRQSDGTTSGGHELYRPHRFQDGDRSIGLFFRDHHISDLIGFVYSRMDPHAAAADLHHRIRAAARSTGNKPAVVSVILDGENAWEYFRRSGREFLKTFYGRVAADSEMRAVTASEALSIAECGTLHHVVPGSWINANFDVWIGAAEDNLAWDLLNDARDFFAMKSGDPALDPEKVRLAEQELWIAEGSDWCWWYGPEHSSAHDAEFDLLYRKHLSNIYHLLGGSPPDELAVPIKRPAVRARTTEPTAPIGPQIDGRVTNYFEWLGAGVYSPDYRSGSMHGGAECVEAMYFGTGKHDVYLRVDFRAGILEEYSQLEIRVNVDGTSRARLNAFVSPRKLGTVQFWKGSEPVLVPLPTGDKVRVAFEQVFELGLDYSLLGLHAGEKTRIQISLWANDLPLQVIPPEGWITIDLTEEVVRW
ncbi:MAG: glycoside hydrolase [Acidobacteria bacterium]|nr:glycoside hydrolase [Acidobacteriota bacterium]